VVVRVSRSQWQSHLSKDRVQLSLCLPQIYPTCTVSEIQPYIDRKKIARFSYPMCTIGTPYQASKRNGWCREMCFSTNVSLASARAGEALAYADTTRWLCLPPDNYARKQTDETISFLKCAYNMLYTMWPQNARFLGRIAVLRIRRCSLLLPTE